MHQVKIIGGAMTRFGRHLDRNLKSLVAEAVNGAFKDAGVTKEQLGGVWVGNASQGVLQGQESVRGQVVMRAMGIGGIPVVNVENACASSATALHGARAMVALGEIDVALAIGMEKMYFELGFCPMGEGGGNCRSRPHDPGRQAPGQCLRWSGVAGTSHRGDRGASSGGALLASGRRRPGRQKAG